MLNLKRFLFSPFDENTYVIWDEATLTSAVVDPGCQDESEENELSDFIDSMLLKIKYLINTHCHIDHIFGNVYVIKKYRPRFIIPEADLELLKMAPIQGKMFGVKVNISPAPDEFLEEDKPIELGESKLTCLFTPGHTPGEFCLYSEEAKLCLSGDVLFYEGIGRTDLWGGSLPVLLKSIKEKLFVLPEDTVIYPGHGEKSTIGHEINYNPFLR
jgi:glyoxylase-like metal-dependent hydrolase (beta-lactamase superfamily II)